MSASPFSDTQALVAALEPLSCLSSICCGNCYWIGKSHGQPLDSQSADKQNMTKDLFINSTMKEKTCFPHFTVGRSCHTRSLHTTLWWWLLESVCVWERVGVCESAVKTSSHAWLRQCVCVCVCVCCGSEQYITAALFSAHFRRLKHVPPKLWHWNVKLEQRNNLQLLYHFNRLRHYHWKCTVGNKMLCRGK